MQPVRAVRSPRFAAMRVVLLGPPGAGKGTQAALLAREQGVPHIVASELLEGEVERGTGRGRLARECMERGELVPDRLMIELIDDRLTGSDRGFVLDGFPRSVPQAEALAELLAVPDRALEAVVSLEVPHDELTRRIARRAAEQGRTDDDPETAPLTDYYRAAGLLLPVDGVGEVAEVAARVRAGLARRP
jgi:adenylate kinase